MKRFLAGVLFAVLATAAQAQQVNYLGTVFLADPTTPTQQLKVNADGSINIGLSAAASPLSVQIRSGLTSISVEPAGKMPTLGDASMVVGFSPVSRLAGFLTPPPVIIQPSLSSAVQATPATSSAVASCVTLKSGPGVLYTVTATIATTSGYLMLFDALSAPADGAVTPTWAPLPVNSNGTNGFVSASFTPIPLAFKTGLTACFSSTGPYTKTASSTAALSAQVQ